jgi:hypothetical protein
MSSNPLSTLQFIDTERLARVDRTPVQEIEARSLSTRPDIEAEFLAMLEEDLRTVGENQMIVFSDADELERYLGSD